VAVHDETHGVVGLSRPTAVAVWRSNDIAGLAFPTASALQQSGLHISDIGLEVWV
jgi:hypothetical protein